MLPERLTLPRDVADTDPRDRCWASSTFVWPKNDGNGHDERRDGAVHRVPPLVAGAAWRRTNAGTSTRVAPSGGVNRNRASGTVAFEVPLADRHRVLRHFVLGLVGDDQLARQRLGPASIQSCQSMVACSNDRWWQGTPAASWMPR